MPGIDWRGKSVAFGLHFLATLILAGLAAALIFLVWFPAPLADMIGGTELFELVIGCDLALGPLLSLVIYDSRKSRGKLVFDYAVVGVLQIAALIYGVYVVAGTRPVYVAFNHDRFEIVTARDIDPAELAKARDPAYARLPLDGPQLVNVRVPESDREDALFEALRGIEEHQRPKFFAPFETGIPAIRARARELAVFPAKAAGEKARIDEAVGLMDVPRERVRWLPARHRLGFWTALVDVQTGRPLEYLPLDPYAEAAAGN